MSNDSAPTRGWLRDVLLFMSGQTVSMFGSMLVQYAVFWYLTIEFESGWIMMLAAVFGFLPQVIVSVFGGVWADRHNRKFLIIAADATIAVTTAVLAVVMLTGYAPLWLIFLTLAIRSAGAGVQQPAVGAMIPQITPPEQLMRVNGILQTIQSIMMLVAPAAAGALFGWAAAVSDDRITALLPIFAIDIVTAVIGIGLLAAVRVRAVDRSAEEPVGYFTDLADGMRYIFHNGLLRWLIVLYAIIFVLMVAPSNLTPLMVVRSFATGSDTGDVMNLTILELAFSIGMALGGIVVATWGAKRNRIGMIIGASIAFGVLSVALGLSPTVWWFFAFMFLTGLSVPFLSTPAMTLIQETVEPARLGRVFGVVGIVMALGMPIGMLAFGPLADVFSIEVLLIVAGVLSVLVVLGAVFLPSGRRAVHAAHEASIAARSSSAAAAPSSDANTEADDRCDGDAGDAPAEADATADDRGDAHAP